MLNVYFGVTQVDSYLKKSDLIFSFATLSFVMSALCKPKRTDLGYIRFLYFHFSINMFSEIFAAVGNFKRGTTFNAVFSFIRIPIFYYAFWLGLKLRKSVAKLPPQELSDFLCRTVLVKGTAAMGPMVFFAFEAISCFISQNSIAGKECTTISNVALLLSLYLLCVTLLSLANKAAPKRVQKELEWQLSAIAKLKLKNYQRLQAGLFVVTAICSLYLLGWLGVEGKYSNLIAYVGALGMSCSIIAVLIGLVVLNKTKNRLELGDSEASEDRATDSETLEDRITEEDSEASETRTSRGFTVSEIEEKALVLTVI